MIKENDLKDKKNLSQPQPSEEEPERKVFPVPAYDVYILSEFEGDNTDTTEDVDSSFASKIIVNLQKSGLVTFYKKRQMPLNQLSPIISASKFVLVLVNEAFMSKLTYDVDLCEEFDSVVSTHRIENIIILVKPESKEYWTGRMREFAPTEVVYWAEKIGDYEQSVKHLVARFGDLSSRNKLAEKGKLNAEKEREKINGRMESIISLLTSTEELFSLLDSEEISKFSVHFLDEDGHSVVTTYFFLFLNQFTINFLSIEEFFAEVRSSDIKDMKGQSFSVPLIEAFHYYKETLYCSGGDYGQLQINGSILDYFEIKIYSRQGTVTQEEKEKLSSFVSRLQSSSSTVSEYPQALLAGEMTTSAITLKKLKYFLIKGIFLILYYELNLLYQAWEFLLFQVMVDIIPVQMVLESLTSCRVKDYQTEFVLVKAFSSERVRKDFLLQRYHPLKKEEKASHLLKNNFESNQISGEDKALVFRELSQLYDNDEHHEKIYHLCGSIHRHRDRWIKINIIQATTITEKEKELLISEFDKAAKWIGYSINHTESFMGSTFESFKDFSELYQRKNTLIKEWKHKINLLIQALLLNNLQDWIFPLLYLLVESIYCSQLLTTHFTQLNLFQLPYHIEFHQLDESKVFQLPTNNYEYHIEISEFFQVLINSHYSEFNIFNRQEEWIKLIHFPFSSVINDNQADLKSIQKYFERRRNSLLENYAMEVLSISETNLLIERLSLIFHQETQRFQITQHLLVGFEIKDFLSEISSKILIFNSIFRGDPTYFLKLCYHDFLEIHLTARKYICLEEDYIFVIYLVWIFNLLLSNQNQDNPSDVFEKDQIEPNNFSFLFEKLPSHYVDQFYAAIEIITQSESSLHEEKLDIKVLVICVFVKFLNIGSKSVFDEESKLYEFLNEIRIATLFHSTFTGDKRNISMEGVLKKQVNSQETLNNSNEEGNEERKADEPDSLESWIQGLEVKINNIERSLEEKEQSIKEMEKIKDIRKEIEESAQSISFSAFLAHFIGNYLGIQSMPLTSRDIDNQRKSIYLLLFVLSFPVLITINSDQSPFKWLSILAVFSMVFGLFYYVRESKGMAQSTSLPKRLQIETEEKESLQLQIEVLEQKMRELQEKDIQLLTLRDQIKMERRIEVWMEQMERRNMDLQKSIPFAENRNEIRRLLQVSFGRAMQLKPLPLPPSKQTHVFLTHPWREDEKGRNNHDRVGRVNEALQKRGLVTWFDSERMSGTPRDEMTDALNATCCVLIFITKKYEEKVNSADEADNCYFEFNVASHDPSLANMRIPIVMEECMLNARNWQGRLKTEMGHCLCFDLSSDDKDVFEERCNEVFVRVVKLLNI